MRRLLFLILALLGALALAAAAALPPAPLPADAPADRFAEGRAMVDIAAIARAPHPTGSAEDARVRDYLVQRMLSLGMVVGVETAPLSEKARKSVAAMGAPVPDGTRATNLIGLLPGQDPAQPAVLLMAHHDTVGGSPGAADDSTGVAAILETVRALKAGPPLRRDLVVLFTDAEELNSDGARGFFSTHPLAKRLGAVVNLEARGGGGRALMFETASGAGPMIDLFARAVHGSSTNSPAVLVYKLLPNYTDFSIPKAMGIAGFNFAFLGRSALYHAPQATPAAIDPRSVQHIGTQVLDLTRALAEAVALPAKGPDAVFSDLYGLVVLAYPAWAGWLVLAAATGLTAVAAVRVRKAGMLRPAAALAGAGQGLGLVLVAVGLLQLFNILSGAGAGANYYDRLAAIPRLEGQALFVCLAVLALATAGKRDEARVWSGWLGLIALLTLVTAAVQAVAPAATPVFAWPLLATALVAALTGPEDLGRCGNAAIRIAIVSAAAGGWLLGLAHLAFLGVGPDLPGSMALFLLLVALPLWPLIRGGAPLPVAIWTALALLTLAVGLAFWVGFDPPAATIPPYARSL